MSSLVRRPEIFCWVFAGRTPRSLVLLAGQIRVSWQNRRTRPGGGGRTPACPGLGAGRWSSSARGCGGCRAARPGPRGGTRRSAVPPRRRGSRPGPVRWPGARRGSGRGAPAAPGPARWQPGRSRRRPGNRGSSEPGTPGSRRCAPSWGGSSSGTGQDHDPGEARQDPGLAHRLQGALPRKNAGYRSVKAPCTYFFCPAGPARKVVSSNPATCAAVISVLISLITPAASSAAVRRQEWMNPAETTAPVTSAISCRHRPIGTCWNTTRARSQGTQPRAGGHRRVRHPRRARRHVLAAAAAQSVVQVMLDPLRGRFRDLQLPERAGHPEIPGGCQVRAALARPLRVVIPGVIGLGPAHRRSRRPRLLPPLAAGRAFRRAPLPAGRLAARLVITRWRHRGVPAAARQGALQPGDPGLQLRDPRIPRGAGVASRGRKWQTGHQA